MAINAQRGAVLIVMACIIVPMLVGYAWPEDRTTNIGWESGDSHDITNAYKTTPIPTYAMDATVISPTWSGAGTGSGYSESETFQQDNVVETLELEEWLIKWSTIDLEAILADAATSGATVYIDASTTSTTSNNNPRIWIDGEEIGAMNYARIVYNGSERVTYLANGLTADTIDLKSRSMAPAWELSVSYILPSSGLPTSTWRLASDCLRGEIGVSLTNVSTSTTTIQSLDGSLVLETIIDADGTITGRVSGGSAEAVTFDDVGTVSTIPWVRWTWNTVNDTVTLDTMTGTFGGNQVFGTWSTAWALQPIRTFNAAFDGDGWYPSLIAYNNFLPAGTQLGIVNAEIRGNEYYPDGSWQLTIRQPSTIGSAIAIGGETYEIIAGNITIQDLEVPVRNMAILATGNGDGTSNVYVNGELVGERVAGPTVTMIGTWNASIILADMNSYTYYTYDKEPGAFGLDVVGFSAVGLLTSVGAFLACALASRRSGGGFAILALVALVCAAFFFIMISNNLEI